jgi:hypothetical protein
MVPPGPPSKPSDCTRTREAPVLDTVVAGVFGGSAYALINGDEATPESAVVGIVLIVPAALYGASAVTGYAWSSRCRDRLPVTGPESTAPAAVVATSPTPPWPPPSAPRVTIGAGTGFPEWLHADASIWLLPTWSIDGRAATFLLDGGLVEGGTTLHLPAAPWRRGESRRSLLLHVAVGGIRYEEEDLAGFPDDRLDSMTVRVGFGYGVLSESSDRRLLFGVWHDVNATLPVLTYTWSARLW